VPLHLFKEKRKKLMHGPQRADPAADIAAKEHRYNNGNQRPKEDSQKLP